MRADQLAINLISLRGDVPAAETLDACAEAGFSNVELFLPRLKQWLEDTPIETVGRMLEERGLACVGGLQGPVECFSAPEKREENHAMHRENAQYLDALGGGVMVAGTDGPAEPSLEALDTVGRACRDLVASWPESVTLAVEFNWSPLVKSLRSAARVARTADHPRVGVLFDPAHYHCTPTKLDEIDAETAPTIRQVHVNNMRKKPGELSHCNGDRLLPDDPEGAIDLRELFGRIEAHGYTGFFSIEMFDEDLWAMPVREAARRLRQSLEEPVGSDRE